jgi:transmembrane 9 superfamily member 2/4
MGGSPFESGHHVSQNLGEILRGDRIMTSDFELIMGKDTPCKALCTQEVDRSGVKRARQLIQDGYVTEWIVDNLPAATLFTTVDRSRNYYASGFKIGFQDYSSMNGLAKYYINNHFTIVIRWKAAPGKTGEKGRKIIVGVEVYPKSISTKDRNENGCPNDLNGQHEGLEAFIPPNMSFLEEKYGGLSYIPADDDEYKDGAHLSIPYTYSVYFREENNIEWASRWDRYFSDQVDSRLTHWLAILNSLTISALLGLTVVVIWGRTVQGDVKGRGDGALEDGKLKVRSKRRRNGSRSPHSGEKPSGSGSGLLDRPSVAEQDGDSASDDEIEDITGWKLLHADVFRIPAYGGLLAPLVGSGMQVLFMASGLLFLSCLGVLNPSFRGGFVSVGMGLFVFAGLFSGYFSGRLYKTFGGQNWRKNTLIVSFIFK